MRPSTVRRSRPRSNSELKGRSAGAKKLALANSKQAISPQSTRSSPSTSATPSTQSSHSTRVSVTPANASKTISQKSVSSPAIAPARWAPYIETAMVGDHQAIFRFLHSQKGFPSDAEYQAQLDMPGYDPSDRLIVRHRRDIVGHVRLVRHNMRIGGQTVPVTVLTDLAAMPELVEVGCISGLIEAAYQQAIHRGSVACIARTSSPGFFAGQGWFVGPRDSCSYGNAREVLAALRGDRPNPLADDHSVPLLIRAWRQVERLALLRLYDRFASRFDGTSQRDATTWQWLIGRRAFDRIYVAIEGPDNFELDDSLDRIVGYAVLGDKRILELVNGTDNPVVAEELVVRACKDLMERNGQYIRYDGPPLCPVHSIFSRASLGQSQLSWDSESVVLMRTVNANELVHRWPARFHAPLAQSQNSPPIELGIRMGEETFKLSSQRKSVSLTPVKSLKQFIECRPTALSQLILGIVGVRESIAAGRVTATSRNVVELAEKIFPKQNWWIPPFDDFPAS